MKKIIVLGGGTFSHIRSHLALAAPAFGKTAKQICSILLGRFMQEKEGDFHIETFLTAMAGAQHNIQWRKGMLCKSEPRSHYPPLVTNEDVNSLTNHLIADPDVKMIFFNVALCDYNGSVDGISGKYAKRLSTRTHREVSINCTPAHKIIAKIRKERKDIFLVGFKTTNGAAEAAQYVAGLRLLKGSSCNLVLANDVGNRRNMIITPEEARYHVTTNRQEALENLVDMALLRSKLTFVRTEMKEGTLIPLNSMQVPVSFEHVVRYCIQNNAYKNFGGKTVGHYGVRLDDRRYLVSRRKNDHSASGDMIYTTLEDDLVVAEGVTPEGTWKPSAGAHTQRELFLNHSEYDCVVHFHCPLKEGSEVPVVSQRAYECGSQECGVNTSRGMRKFGNLSAVFLDNHGPNIIFNRNIHPQEVIDFIQANFDLSGKTGGVIGVE